MTNHISLPVSELKSALQGFSKIIGRRTTLPVLGCLKVERDRDGAVSLQATNLDDTATFRLKEISEGLSFSCLVPFEPLLRTVKSASPKDHIVLVDEGKKGLRLRSFAGGSQIDQPLERIDLKEYPPAPEIKSTAVKLESGFGEAFRQAFDCASEDTSRVTLNGIYLDVSDKKAHYVVSTNARVLFSANSFAFNLPKPIVIPSHKFLGWNGWMENDECWLAYEPGKKDHAGWIQLKSGNWSVVTREVEGQYPNWRNIIPANEAKTVIRLNEVAVKTLLEVLPKLPGEQENNSPVGLRVEKAKLVLEAKNKEDDKASVVPVPDALIIGKDMMVRINRHYLVMALKYGLTEITHTTPAGQENPVLVCQSHGRKLVIALLGEPKDQQAPSSTVSPATAETNESKEPTDDEKTDMTRTSNKTETTKPTESSASLIDQVEKIKDSLKNVVRDLSNLVDTVKLAEKEKRANEKEVEAARATLKKLQQVTI